MEKRLVPFSGFGLQTQDLASISDNAARADDRILAELLRPEAFVGGTVAKVVLPSARSGRSTTSYITGSAVVIPSGAGDASTHVRPFRAIVGVPGLITSVGSLGAWRDIRSAIHHGTIAEANVSLVQHAATSNNRWDLIWARVDLDVDLDPTPRFVKSGAGVVSSQNVTPYKTNTVTIGVTQGAHAGSPTRPALPADVADTTYYFPLAFVLLQHPHTLTDPIEPEMIYEVAPTAYLGEATGARTLAPANGCYTSTGYAEETDPWSTSGRPESHLPPSMVGGVSRFFRVHQLAIGTHLIDDSIDWRRRFVKWHAQSSTGIPAAPTTAGSSQLQKQGIDNSVGSGDQEILRLVATDGDAWRANILATGSAAVGTLQVNATTGALELVVTGDVIPTICWVWLEASGQWDNAE